MYKLIEQAGVVAKFDPRKNVRQGCLDSRSEHPQLKKGCALCQRLIAQLAADQRSQPLNRRTALRLAAEIELKAQISAVLAPLIDRHLPGASNLVEPWRKPGAADLRIDGGGRVAEDAEAGALKPESQIERAHAEPHPPGITGVDQPKQAASACGSGSH